MKEQQGERQGREEDEICVHVNCSRFVALAWMKCIAKVSWVQYIYIAFRMIMS